MIERSRARSEQIADLAKDESEYLYEDEAHAVRPYAVTGGRVRSETANFPVEALVEALPNARMRTGLTPERRAIIERCANQYLSIAELSAYVQLPVGVVRIVVADLVEENLVRIHGVSSSSDYSPATTMSVLESVLNGISSL
ncbi:MAG TPA: DUF742 domain-containing protein [Actinomycetales bacterium]|nr:DUF742 domain-containing protein [Actinomycetales bacterium]